MKLDNLKSAIVDGGDDNHLSPPVYQFTIKSIESVEIKQAEKDKECRNPFYTAKPVTKRVTKEEFNAFIRNYPRKLDVDVYGVSEPPNITYNDFELAAKWPYSIVASTFLYDDDPNDYYYLPEEDRNYTILENYEEVFESRKLKMLE